MEDSSHELIDQMIAEERYCYGFETIPGNIASSEEPQSRDSLNQVTAEKLPSSSGLYTLQTSSKNQDGISKALTDGRFDEDNVTKMVNREVEVQNTFASPTSTHNKRWSAEEDDLLVEGVKQFGYGKWEAISKQVKSRTSLQCKNRARQNSQLFSANTKVTQAQPIPNLTGEDASYSNSPNSATYTSSPYMNLDPGSFTSPSIETAVPIELKAQPPFVQVTFPNRNIQSMDQKVIAKSVDFDIKNKATENKDISAVEHQLVPLESTSTQNRYISDSVTEVEIQADQITENERRSNAEWFMGKPAKSPERYMRIRNHIIDCWKSTRPIYLTKTAGRRNLRDGGDVNAVGRIHAYLESIHAINVNCVSPNKRSYPRPTRQNDDSPFRTKKTKRTPGFYWADVDTDEEPEKKVPGSNIITGDGNSRPKRSVKKRETFYDENYGEFGYNSDPFRLVPVGYYPTQSTAPFTVEITSDALLVMDFHSHLAYTEIIGLLGGRVLRDEYGVKLLKVEYVFPCRSTSTGIQCEMDPVSEMAARELFEKKGLQVVGWYHSHPTFEPEPSIRDIENQASYQDLFRDDSSGIEPFIGVIITPYNSTVVSDRSQIQFIHISNRWSSNNSYRLPFACIHKVTQCPVVSQDVLDIFQGLLFEYQNYEHKIDMSLSFGPMTRAEKLLRSLQKHLFMSPEDNKLFLERSRSMLQDIYINNNGEKQDDNSQKNQLAPESNQNNMENAVTSLAI